MKLPTATAVLSDLTGRARSNQSMHFACAMVREHAKQFNKFGCALVTWHYGIFVVIC
jgi:hypothetical protein